MTAPVSVSAPLSTWRAVRHLCRFDLARYRVLIAAMVGLELLRAAYVEWTLQLAPIVIGERLTTAAGEVEVYMLDLAIWAMTWVVTAVVVQGDSPVRRPRLLAHAAGGAARGRARQGGAARAGVRRRAGAHQFRAPGRLRRAALRARRRDDPDCRDRRRRHRPGLGARHRDAHAAEADAR